MTTVGYTINLAKLGLNDIDQVGGKNASLGEMIRNLSHTGVRVPGGFATTATAFRQFLSQGELDKEIKQRLERLDVEDVRALADCGQQIRQKIIDTPFVPKFEEAIRQAYQTMEKKIGTDDFSVAVRSSATAEDLPDASFAGQQETVLNVRGLDNILVNIKKVFASLYNDRAIAYRVHHNYAHHDVALSVGVQQMVRSDKGTSGVLFTMDTESGFDQVIFITAAYGLGEMVVQGAVNPDEFYLFKPNIIAQRPAIVRRTLGTKNQKMVYADSHSDSLVKIVPVDESEQRLFCLTEEEATLLAKQALLIEKHYKRPMDIEWAKDGITGDLFILQARPETVKSHESKQKIERYQLNEEGKVLVEGRSIGQRIGQGIAKIINDISEMDRVQPGDVLVSDMTDPDWEPVMKRAAAIVTNRGGRTCHAAIIARELGIPAVVGCGKATHLLEDGQPVTVSCAQGDDGYVYEGLLKYDKLNIDVGKMPELPVKIMLNIGNPERAFSFQTLPNSGVGLARLEFLISNTIGIHPKALLQFDTLEDENLKETIKNKTEAYNSPVDYYVQRLKEGIATIACAFYPKPVIVRLSDFKSNEYSNLLGGSLFEPGEENPMLGFRGASRYVSPQFSDCFALECQAVRLAREEMGLTNIEVMIPFVRTVEEAAAVSQVLADNGLVRGHHDLKIIMMCELPSNALLAEAFLEYFDGFSIGSNDLTQLILGLDRDSSLVAQQFDERNPAVKVLLHKAISTCLKLNKYVGICGQGPSDHKDFATWLMNERIDSVSLNPDSVIDTVLFLGKGR